MKLSTRIALAVGAAVPLLVLAAGWLLYLLVAHDLHHAQDHHLRQRAAQVSGDARRLLRVTAADRPAVAQVRARQMYAAALDVGVRVVGPAGSVSGGPQPRAGARLPSAQEAARRPVTVRDRGRSWRALCVPVHGVRPGVDGTLWLFSPDTADQEQLASVRDRVVGVAVLAAPLSGLLAWAAASRAGRPLRRLQQRTSGLDPRADGARLEHTPTGITEVDDLAATLRTVLSRYDEQAARTAEALATARSFSSAAAHELRTPLMSMQTNLEILGDHPDLAAEDRAEVLADLRGEHTRMLGLLVMLRELGKGDLVEADAFAPVDLAEVVEASVADARRRDRTASVAVTAEPGLTVRGWEPGLRTLLDNLLANALTHGRDAAGRARVAVALRRAAARDGAPGAGTAVLTVDDHGPGIEPDRRDAVFQRFARGPSSTGSGLGLTLVAQQADLHRARVRVLDRPAGAGAGGTADAPEGEGSEGDGGTRFEVCFPLDAREPAAPAGGPPDLPAQRDWLIGASVHPRPEAPPRPRSLPAPPARRPYGQERQEPQENHKDGL